MARPGQGADDLDELYRLEHRRMERRIARRVGSMSVARDLVHDIFLRLLDRTESQRSNPAGFLSRAARNAAIDHLRKERMPVRYATETSGGDPPTSSDPSYERLERMRQIERIQAVVNRLPETTQRLFILNRVDGHGFSRLARDSQMSERNVAKHMAKALAACTAALDDHDE